MVPKEYADADGLLYRQKDKLLRLIVFKVQKSVCLKIYVAKLVIVQRLVLNIN